MMAWQSLLLLALIGTVMGAPDRRPDGRRIIRSTDSGYSPQPRGQSLFLRSTPHDVSSADGSLLQVGSLTIQEDNAPKTHSVSESPLAIGGQTLIQPPQLAFNPVFTQTESYSAPISPPLQLNSAGSRNQGEFNFVNTINPSPGLDATSTTQLESQEVSSGDLGRTLANILYQLTGGAVQSLDGVSLPNSKSISRGKVHIYTATDPKDELPTPPQPKVPIIIRPREQTRTFIAISPPNVQVPYSIFPSSALNVPHQHQALPPTYQQRPFQHSPVGQGNVFISNPLTGHEPTATFTGSRGESFDRNRESFSEQNFFVSNPKNDEEGFHDTHLNGNMQSSFSSPGGAGTTINTGASYGSNFRGAILTGPFVQTSAPAVQNVESFPPAPHTNSATHKSIPAIQNVQTFTPPVQTGPAAQTFTPTIQKGPFIHNPDPAIQNIQTFPPVQTDPAVQNFAPTVQNGPFIPQPDPAAQNVQTIPPVQTDPAVQNFVPTVQNGPFIPQPDPAAQNVQTIPPVQTDPAVQNFVPTVQNGPFIPQPDPAAQNVQTIPPVQTDPAVQNFVPTVQNGPFIPQSDPAAQNVQTFPPVQTGSAIQTFAQTVQNGPFIHTSAAAAAVQNVQTFPPTMHTGPTAQTFAPTVQSSPTIAPVTNTIQTSHSVQNLASAVQTSPFFQNFAPTVQNIPALAPVDQNVQTFSQASQAPAPAGFPPQQIHASVHGSQFGPSLNSVGPTEGAVSNIHPYPSLTFRGEVGIGTATPQSSAQSHQTFVSDSAVSGAVFDNSGIQTSDSGESGSVSDASGAPQSLGFSASHGFEDGRGLRAVSISNIHSESDSTSLNAAHGSTSTATQFRTNSFVSTGNSLQTGTSVEGPGVPLSISIGEQQQRQL